MNSNMDSTTKDADVEQIAIPDLTSSQTGTFYFAYGSNLSPEQMSIRLSQWPSSSIPVAIGYLPSYTWIICSRGYANVVALPASSPDTDTSRVWGVIYNMVAEAEARLDMYEGHNSSRNDDPEINPDPTQQHIKPYLQGNWDYNKLYLPIMVTKWLEDPNQFGVSMDLEMTRKTTIRALVYVDEDRVKPGEINEEYIGRMNRGIRQAVELGVPQSWVDKVMRPFIPVGIEVEENGYVGTDEGYVPSEATETLDHSVKENDLKSGD